MTQSSPSRKRASPLSPLPQHKPSQRSPLPGSGCKTSIMTLSARLRTVEAARACQAVWPRADEFMQQRRSCKATTTLTTMLP